MYQFEKPSNFISNKPGKTEVKTKSKDHENIQIFDHSSPPKSAIFPGAKSKPSFDNPSTCALCSLNIYDERR
jgi:hypothetical protein